MKWLPAVFVVLGFMISAVAEANYCMCQVVAVAPMEGSHKVENHIVAEFEGKFYGNYDYGAVRNCRSDCAIIGQRRYDEETLKDKLLPWVDELVAYGFNGYNCTGPTTFKVPVRIRASLGRRTLGIARQQMIFIHRERSCFI